ncbi:MAG: RdgB/HAM1 family non-canonical purine NTP pyrophosphatase [Ruminococcaceae bacterium]|nr:RdgB/HAM1 family non-canonical purine NTP pyrophosphatase [Oscillospiraceae bacterium]
MKIVLASRNKKKIAELEKMMSEYLPEKLTILSLDDIGLKDDIEENGSTFEENARIKAKAGAALGYITIADDSGLCVDALDGAPGVYSARFSGGGDKENNKLLIEKLKDVPEEKRTAHFMTSVVCVFPEQNDEIVATGKVCGIITENASGTNGFGYDPHFFYPPYNKTFAELTADEKNAISHRGKAMKAFAELFLEKIKEYNLI